MKRLKVFVVAVALLVVPFVALTGCILEPAREERLPLVVYQTDELYFKNGYLSNGNSWGSPHHMEFPIISNRPLESVDAIRVYNEHGIEHSADAAVWSGHRFDFSYIRIAEQRYLNNLYLLIHPRVTHPLDIRRMAFDIEGQTVEFVTDFAINFNGQFEEANAARVNIGVILEEYMQGGTVAMVSFLYQDWSGGSASGLMFDRIESLLCGIDIVGLYIAEWISNEPQNQIDWIRIEATGNLGMMSFRNTRLRVYFDFGDMLERSIFFGHNFKLTNIRSGHPHLMYLSASNGRSGIRHVFENVARGREWALES